MQPFDSDQLHSEQNCTHLPASFCAYFNCISRGYDFCSCGALHGPYRQCRRSHWSAKQSSSGAPVRQQPLQYILTAACMHRRSALPPPPQYCKSRRCTSGLQPCSSARLCKTHVTLRPSRSPAGIPRLGRCSYGGGTAVALDQPNHA